MRSNPYISPQLSSIRTLSAITSHLSRASLGTATKRAFASRFSWSFSASLGARDGRDGAGIIVFRPKDLTQPVKVEEARDQISAFGGREECEVNMQERRGGSSRDRRSEQCTDSSCHRQQKTNEIGKKENNEHR